MGRSIRASAARLGSRVGTGSLVFGVMTASVFGSGTASAQPGSNEIAALVTDLANANQKLQDLGASIQTRQESVNKAIADVQTARENADAAQQEIDVSQNGLKDANAAIAAAQAHFDKYAEAAYINGPSASYLTASDPGEMINTAATGQALTISSQQAIADLQRSRTELANRESAARLAKQKADEAVKDAQSSQDVAVKALTDVKTTFAGQQTQLDQLVGERNAAQVKLDAARAQWSATATSHNVPAVPAQPGGDPGKYAANWDGAPGAPAAAGGGQKWDDNGGGWDPTLPRIPSANISGDPIAVINSVLGVTATSAQVTQQMGHSFLQKLGLVPADVSKSGFTNGAIPRVYGKQASEYVIKRAMTQIGVPYSWGGGTAAGPSKGIDSGAGTTGFDCSGLIMYAFAGVGIKLPHYSGNQYEAGRKIPTSQARRGDVIFYGPGGSQHVTLYLGDGKMLEAPYTGSDVHISPVRTSGMTPYVIRYIEY
ncbi:NlpC/P60 family peptidoglycan endopeptidase RipA [Mycobacterium sp. CBMA293]|uniref:NlpC/P60 family peptidoglycan endopeptidase RipA n=2 Tax=Mycolicibacterium TaxID=1866885 RepID=UPI0012DD9A34|nr:MULTISPECIES: NlpC/P60 family peptidoglycan endopeptidase RipA [unclassified Mycolicibacterium]MUL48128.1 NlpC/P60 family peptidoglycan endopeptidase RipA [Mycolicibacterium sp. CBMA 360]MUL58307.1 NlpC/P60 family peptidoglycan endopeptidase RipA [Mycolicibacterium sp. CBMA 335]MUL73765.1 NlpC/P60 family peptidoglycan endopeptidase RipA [Mycolicibacterium sp. CBMA 311]MUL93190.1 NlpC/P60 family peptidoglycan endopeptidase RipA [Mycolicibacterium sp. CBMA 230]MUM07738.1 peptidase M23 [Mycoli